MFSFLQYIDKEIATLIAASLAAIVSLVSLTVSVWSSRVQARLVNRLTELTNLNKESREYKLNQLTLLYDPIYTLLSANKNIFEIIGPTSKTRREQRFNDLETAEVWKKLSIEVIAPNNNKICEIIHENLHYSSDFDDESLYLEFISHAQAYKSFKQEAYGAYRLFPYPSKIYASVENARKKIRSDINSMYFLRQ